MIDRSRWLRASSLAVVLALTASPIALAKGPGAQHARQAAAMHPQAVPHHISHAPAPRANSGAMTRPNNRIGAGGYNRGYARGNGNGNQNNGQVVSALHSAMGQLNQAQYDYQGHRARAIHHLGLAIQHLSPQAARPGAMNAGLVGAGGINRIGAGNGNANAQRPAMPQAQSDAHLRQAHQSLMAIESRMVVGGNGGNAGQHAQARVSVQRAIQELNTALAIR